MSGSLPLAEVDYSAIERRTMAWMAEWPALMIYDAKTLHAIDKEASYRLAYGDPTGFREVADEEGAGAAIAAALFK